MQGNILKSSTGHSSSYHTPGRISAFMLKKIPQQIKKYFSSLIVGNETSITNKCSETGGGIKRNHYFLTAWIFCSDSLLLTICRLQFSSVQLSTVTLRWSREGFPNENAGKGQTCFHTPTGNEKKTVKVKGKTSAEAIAPTAAYSTQDRQTIKCKETNTRSESSLHTTNWCSKTIIQMFLSIFCQLFSKDFFKLSQCDFMWKTGIAMTTSNQACSLFEKTRRYGLEMRTKFAVETRRDWKYRRCWASIGDAGRAQFSPNTLKRDNTFWLESTTWLAPFSRWTS